MTWLKKNVLVQMGILSFRIVFFVCLLEHKDAQSICPEITQQILKDGFHRDLLTKINFVTADERIGNCVVAIKVYLPRGLYVDPYELASLQKHNLTEALVVAHHVDLEVPEYLATDVAVLIFMRPEPECFYCFRAVLPMHLRYHRPAENDGEISAVLKNPDMLIHCQKPFLSTECLKETEIEAPCSQKNERTCLWDSVNFKAVNKELKMQIPVGLKGHLFLVCTVTLVITTLCTSLILSALCKHGYFSFERSL